MLVDESELPDRAFCANPGKILDHIFLPLLNVKQQNHAHWGYIPSHLMIPGPLLKGVDPVKRMDKKTW